MHAIIVYIIVEIYRPPRLPVEIFLLDLTKFLETVSKSNNPCYVLGDLNINMLNFPRPAHAVELLSTSLSYSFVPLVNRPTRVTASAISLIDYIISNDSGSYINSSTDIVMTSLSDRFMIHHSIVMQTARTFRPKKYSASYLINERTLTNFKNVMVKQNWELLPGDIENYSDTNPPFDSFSGIFSQTIIYSQE